MTSQPPTTAGNSMPDLSLHSVQNDYLVVPPPGRRVSSSTAALYLISDPLPADISILEFRITSHDQGYCSDPTKGTWTWFEVSIIRPLCEEEPRSDIINLKHNAGVKSRPEDFGSLLQEQGWYFEDIPVLNTTNTNTGCISRKILNNPVSSLWSSKKSTWSRAEPHSDFISLLQEGDRLIIWARAQFPGWFNHVQEVQIALKASSRNTFQISVHPRITETLFKDRQFPTSATTDLPEAIYVTCDNHSDQAAYFNKLALRFRDRFSRTGTMVDLEKAIHVGRQAIDATPHDHPDRAGYLKNLSISLADRFSHTIAMIDLDEAIKVAQQAVDATPDDYAMKAELLTLLGTYLDNRYSRTGALTDLDESIQVAQQAVDSVSNDHPHRAGLLHNLGNHLDDRYSHTGALVDLDEAIRVTRQAVDAPFENYPGDHPPLLNILGIRLAKRYEYIGDMADLQDAIDVTRQAVNATSDNNLDKIQHLNNLGNHLGDRFSRTGDMADLEEAIQLARQAVGSIPGDYPYRAALSNMLGTHLSRRYSRTGDIADLEKAIQLAREAVDATQDNHKDHVGRLYNLGQHLHSRYCRTGDMADLEEAIQLTRKSIEATPYDHTDQARKLDKLGVYLARRYSHIGAMVDLEETIQVARQAVDTIPDDHSGLATLLNHLGLHLHDRYSRTRDIADLEEAIQLTRKSIDHTAQAEYLNNLGNHLRDRYSHTKDITDLDEAIQVTQQAIDAIPDDHPERAAYLYNLGIRLDTRHSHTGAMADLEKAVQLAQEAVGATPHNHPERSLRLFTLGQYLRHQCLHTGAMADLKLSTSCYNLALHQVTSRTATRIKAGKGVLINAAQILDWKQAYEASSLAVSLVPKVIPRVLENSDKQHILSQMPGLASDAAAAALNFQQPPLVALRLLEQGRGLLAASTYEMRMDIMNLQEVDPVLAKKFIAVREQLQSPVVSEINIEQTDRPSWQSQSDQRHKADEQFNKLVAEIRDKKGFETFLGAPSLEEMQDTAASGPIAVINVSTYRCDAILVETHQIRLLTLPNLNQEEIKTKAVNKDLGSPEVLQWLWDVVAEPVLNALGYTDRPSSDQWPHVWWIPTGLLTRFPLHAAGYHDRASSQTVIDRVMSSYSPSIKAMIQSRRRPQMPTTAVEALLVAMGETPGHSSLPYAPEEVEKIRELCQRMSLTPVEPSCYKSEVESHLPQSKIFHFAGHGYTHPSDPSMSSLVLMDGQSHPLTVGGLFELNLRKASPFLAYLSACGTGRVWNEKFMDESIHLISGCQLAGFRHVIGTLWDVIDETCVDMATMTYQEMRDGNMTDESVCRGLHSASRALRDRWLKIPAQMRGRRGGRDIQPEGGETSSLDWVPYVHFGV